MKTLMLILAVAFSASLFAEQVKDEVYVAGFTPHICLMAEKSDIPQEIQFLELQPLSVVSQAEATQQTETLRFVSGCAEISFLHWTFHRLKSNPDLWMADTNSADPNLKHLLVLTSNGFQFRPFGMEQGKRFFVPVLN